MSGGQLQRIAIARAMIRKPRILLLDEATSALDGVTEESVMMAIRGSMPGLTVVMVAHRLSTVRLCDRIYLIEKGRVAAQGTYDELYRSNRVFRQMVESSQRNSQTEATGTV